MKKLSMIFSLLLTAVMVLGAIPAAVYAQGTPTPTPVAGAGGPIRGANIQPASGRQQLILLSDWKGFTLVDKNGKEIGQVQDYIINMCEAHILYMLVQPGGNQSGQATPQATQSSSSNTAQGGSVMLVPFEAVTVNGGSINAEKKTITLNLDAKQLSGAPTMNMRPDLSGINWEGNVRSFWKGIVSLSSLDTGCTVVAAKYHPTPGANIEPNQNEQSVNAVKLAYASNLMGAALQDGNQNNLGKVQDALIEPESGQLFYLAVVLQNGKGITLVPMGAVNVPQDANAQQGQLNLVFLLKNSVLQNAPTIDSLKSIHTNANTAAHDYWNQYLMLGPSGQ